MKKLIAVVLVLAGVSTGFCADYAKFGTVSPDVINLGISNVVDKGVSWTSAATTGFADKGYYGLVIGAAGTAPWSASDSNALWMTAGFQNPSGFINAIYKSTDGIVWTLVGGTGLSGKLKAGGDSLTPRVSHATFWSYEMMAGVRMYVMGGFNEVGQNNEVWWTAADGVAWTQLANAPWSARQDMAYCVHGGYMFVMGGYSTSGGGNQRDVFYTQDGVNWNQAVGYPGWQAMAGHRAISFKGHLWVITSASYTEVWYSDSVETGWTRTTAAPGWTARTQFGLAADDNKMYVFGGANNEKDCWSSADGTNWVRGTSDAGWGTGAAGAAGVVFQDKLWWTGYYKDAHVFSSAGISNVVQTVAGPTGVSAPVINFQPSSAAISTNTGTVYFDAATKKLMYWRGDAWMEILANGPP